MQSASTAVTVGVFTPPDGHADDRPSPRTRGTVWVFVLGVAVLGGLVLARSAATFREDSLGWPLVLLTVLTLASNRVKVKVPGRPASVSFTELFVFSSVLLLGPAPATLTVALNGLVQSLNLKNRRVYRTLFNVAEPAISTWMAGTVFFAIAGPLSLGSLAGRPTLVLATIGMTATYFVLNSGLTALAVALEQDGSAVAFWRQHALYLGINYYAAASLAAFGISSTGVIRFEIVGLVAPIMILSYVAYQSAASRLQDAGKHVGEVEHLYQAAIETLAIAVDAKDQITHGHIRRVQRHTLTVAQAMDVTDPLELKALKAAALLHDVGKLAVPDYVLNKPGALSHAEYDRIKVHAVKGAEILTAVDFPYPVVPIVRHHHEHWNGGGYPDGLSGSDIPLGARILSVVDCFDALTSDRPYRRKMRDEDAIEILRTRRGTMYDPDVVDAFIGLIPELRAVDASVDVPKADAAADGVLVPPVRRFHTEDPRSLISTLSLIGPAMEEKLARLMPDAECCLFAPDPSGDTLVAAHATPLIRRTAHSLHMRIGEGLSGWVAANRHTIVNSPADLELGDTATTLNLRWCMSTPVFALGDVVGILTVYSSGADRFSERGVHLIATLAQEVGMDVARGESGLAEERDQDPAARRRSTAVC